MPSTSASVPSRSRSLTATDSVSTGISTSTHPAASGGPALSRAVTPVAPNFEVVAGSGTGELTGLRGTGTFTARHGETPVPYRFDYELG